MADQRSFAITTLEADACTTILEFTIHIDVYNETV